MILSIVGILVATLAGLYGVFTGEGETKKKSILSILAVLGAAVSVWATAQADQDAKVAKADLNSKLASSAGQLDRANQRLADQAILLGYINNSVGQLDKLNGLGGTHSYYVRLAYGRTAEELRKYQDGLLAQFPGEETKNLIVVRQTRRPEGYELVFGTKLTLASAEVFGRMAEGQGFANGRAQIRIDE